MAGGEGRPVSVGEEARRKGRQAMMAMVCGRMRKEKGEEWTPAALPYPIEQGQYGPI